MSQGYPGPGPDKDIALRHRAAGFRRDWIRARFQPAIGSTPLPRFSDSNRDSTSASFLCARGLSIEAEYFRILIFAPEKEVHENPGSNLTKRDPVPTKSQSELGTRERRVTTDVRQAVLRTSEDASSAVAEERR